MVDLSWHKRSGRLRDIQTGEILKIRKGGLRERCHVNDMKLFVPREGRWLCFDKDLKGVHKLGANVVDFYVQGKGWASREHLADLPKQSGAHLGQF